MLLNVQNKTNVSFRVQNRNLSDHIFSIKIQLNKKSFLVNIMK